MAKKVKPTAEEVLKEFCDDVQLAYGTGKGTSIDKVAMDWPDLAITYKKAIDILYPKGR